MLATALHSAELLPWGQSECLSMAISAHFDHGRTHCCACQHDVAYMQATISAQLTMDACTDVLVSTMWPDDILQLMA